jgi:hypothetical protein
MKIGSVSWVKKGTYLENARLLEKHVDFVELLVYTWDENLKTLLEKELPGLKGLDLFYTVHMPMDNIRNCAAAYIFFKQNRLPIKHFVLHPIPGWKSFIEGKSDVTLENMIDIHKVYERMTLDVGHLYLSGKDEEVLGDKRLKKIKEVHLHGISRSKDHRKLNAGTLRYLGRMKAKHKILKAALSSPGIYVNFEIFNYKRLLESIRIFKREYVQGSQR